jgi:membrane associated rhomboid family serine protease
MGGFFYLHTMNMETIKSNNIVPPIRLVFFMWLIYTIEYSMGLDFGFLGISPRTVSGLIGIITAPLIHGSVAHLASNTLPILILGGGLYFFYPRIAPRIFLQCYLFTNFFVWLFARPFYHIGASGLVYALAFFMISFGIFKRDLKSILISGLVILFYGGLFYSVTSLNSKISWESHLLGAVVGVANAYVMAKFTKNRNY